MLGLGDNAPRAIPTARLVEKLAKEPHLLLAGVVLRLSLGLQVGRQGIKARVFGQAHHVLDVVALAPPWHFPAAQAAVGPQADAHPLPVFPERFDQQSQHRPSVAGPIAVTRPQVTDQQLLAAENVQWQEDVLWFTSRFLAEVIDMGVEG